MLPANWFTVASEVYVWPRPSFDTAGSRPSPRTHSLKQTVLVVPSVKLAIETTEPAVRPGASAGATKVGK